MTRLLSILFVGLLAFSASATDYYWTNSQPVNAQYWAGDTIHFVGTFSSPLTITNNGTAVNPITFHFEPNAKFSEATLPPNSTWLGMNGMSHIVIDGGQNGRIELTDNGTLISQGGSFDYNNGNILGIWGNSLYDITIKNLKIAGMFVRQADLYPTNDGNSIAAIFSRDSSNITISNCVVADSELAISLTYNSAGQSNIVVAGCIFTNYAWGFSMAAESDNAMLDNLIITNNYFGLGDAWEGTNVSLHRNSVYLRYDIISGGGRMSNILFAFNYIKGGSDPKTVVGGTSGMSFSLNSPTNAQHLRIFNNIGMMMPMLSYSAGSGPQLGYEGTDVLFANNTVIGWTNSGTGLYGGSGIGGELYVPTGTNDFIYNNIIISAFGQGVTIYAVTNGNLTFNSPTVNSMMASMNLDYNIWNYQIANSFAVVVYTNGVFWNEGTFDSIQQFKNYIPSQEQHSSSSIVQLGPNFAPLSTDTVAIGHGTNLTAYAIANNLPGLLVDFAGNPRPATGPWDIGAYQHVSSGITPGVWNVTGTLNITGTLRIGQ